MRPTIGILICVFVLTSCISTEEPNKVVSVPPGAPTSAPAPQGGKHHPTWPARTNHRTGITVRVPPSWSLVWNPLRDGTLGDILVAGSMRFPTLPECEPIPRGQALLALSEFRPSEDEPLEGLERDFPPRPYRFETTVLRPSQIKKGCVQPRAQLFRFLEADRFLYAWVMFGRDLSTGLRTKTEAVLSTLEVQPPNEPSPLQAEEWSPTLDIYACGPPSPSRGSRTRLGSISWRP